MKVIDFETHERELADRKAALGFHGYDHVMRNDGTRRTPEKRAILAELKRLGSPFLVDVDVAVVGDGKETGKTNTPAGG